PEVKRRDFDRADRVVDRGQRDRDRGHDDDRDEQPDDDRDAEAGDTYAPQRRGAARRSDAHGLIAEADIGRARRCALVGTTLLERGEWILVVLAPSEHEPTVTARMTLRSI